MGVGGGGQGGMGGQSQGLLSEAIETVGPAGKKIQTTHAKLTIPAGALKKNVQISVSELSADEAGALPATDDAVPALSTPVKFKPHGLSFDQDVDVELTTPLDSPKNPVVLKLDDDQDDTWELVTPAQFGATGAKFKTRSFSIYRVFDDPQHLAEQIYLPPNGGTGGSGAGGSPSAGGASTAGSSAGGQFASGGSGGAAVGGFVGAGGTFPAGGFPGIGGSVAAGGSGGSGGITGAGGAGAGGAPTANSVIQTELGLYHSCSVLADGAVKCWGINSSSQLGLGDTNSRGNAPGQMGTFLPPVNLGTGRIAASLAVGNDHNCVLFEGQTVKCWGANYYGQLGLGDGQQRGDQASEMGDYLPEVNFGTGRIPVALAAGGDTSCAILDNGSLKCWGKNTRGQLGLGDTTSRGISPGSLGDNLPAIDLGTGVTVSAVTVGQEHVCALLNDGTLKCWGDNSAGQLGLGDVNHRGDDPLEMGDYLPTVDLGTGRMILAVAALDYSTCALLDAGEIKCWGNNTAGELGMGHTNSVGTSLDELGDALPAIDLGSGNAAIDLAAGGRHACAIFSDRSFKCWGANDEGQLGIGEYSPSRGDYPTDMGDNLTSVNFGAGLQAWTVSAGGYHTCAATPAGELKCWGNGLHGQLGTGDTGTRGYYPADMGDNLLFVSLW